jgi:hypothetical protein
MRSRLIALVLPWAIAVAIGIVVVLRYSATPGAAASAPSQWPSDSKLRRSPGFPTLVMLVHPRCSCSRASLGELAEIMTKVRGAVRAHVLFVNPPDTPPGWDEGDLRSRAESIAGVTVTTDDAAREAARFGAVTSGQTLVYDRDGKLVFSGGITAARGHTGDNVGRASVLSTLNGMIAQAQGTPVFGCALAAGEDRD